jgi:hypothetical protein
VSDFFTRIASRELGVAPVVQPVMGSRYAPTAEPAAPPGISFAAGRSNTAPNPMPQALANPAEQRLERESPANRPFPSTPLLNDAAELSESSSLLNDVETAVPETAQPTQSQLNSQTPDALVAGAETEERSPADSRARTQTRASAARASGEVSAELSTLVVGERTTIHPDFENVIAERESANVKDESASGEQERLIAEREPVIPESESGAFNSAATVSPESGSLDLKRRVIPKVRAARRIAGEPMRQPSSAAEFETEDETDTAAESSRARAETTIEPRLTSHLRQEAVVSATIATPESIALHEEEIPEQVVNARPTSPRGRDAVRGEDGVEAWLIARRGENDSDLTNRSEPTDFSGPTNVSRPTIEVRSTSTRRGVDALAGAPVEEIGPEPRTGSSSAASHARAVVDPHAVVTRQAKHLGQTAEVTHSPQVMKDVVPALMIGRTEKDAPSSTIEVEPATLRRATVAAPPSAVQRVERSEPAINSKPASPPRRDALRSRATAAVNSQTIATPEAGRVTADSQVSSRGHSQPASSTPSSRSEAVDHEPAREKKQAQDARSNQHRAPARRDHSEINQSPAMAAERPLRSSRNAPEPRAAAEKIIRVTIGRIEVHAAQPPPPPVETPAPPAPQLSLDEFLRQHNGRRP